LQGVTRCVYKHIKAFTPPSTFHKAVAEKEITGVFPKKYHASLKTMISTCIDKFAKTAKGAKEDKEGKTWAGMYKCFSTWYSNVSIDNTIDDFIDFVT